MSYALHDSMTIRTHQWRLNESLLHDKDVLADITRELDFYFKTNDTPDTPVTLALSERHTKQLTVEC